MKQLFSILMLLVLTLGVAQAYSPPEEFNDQANIVMVTDVDQAVVLDVAPVVAIHKYSFSETVSNISESAQWPDTAIRSVNDVGDLHNDIFIKQWQFSQSFKNKTRYGDGLISINRQIVPAVPWRSLKRSSIHLHYHT